MSYVVYVHYVQYIHSRGTFTYRPPRNTRVERRKTELAKKRYTGQNPLSC